MSYIYFIQAQDNGPVKIGYTTSNPRKRMQQIQTSCPWPVKLLGAIKGTVSQEKQIHLVLGRYKTQGEWFDPHHVVVAAVNLALECGVPAPYDEPAVEDVELVSELIDKLGGNIVVGGLTGSSPKAVSNWRALGRFPASTYLILKDVLAEQNCDAPDHLWAMKPVNA